jgi:alpha-D-xyloside xylohydrolase
MDFPKDPAVANIGDEYMLGPAFLVAPVTEQGRETRQVYLPVGSDWYNFWTGEKFKGGQTLSVAAPIDIIPLFVRAGSIIPMGVDVQNTASAQVLKEIRVYPGKAAEFTLYDDDGVSNDYERGKFTTTTLRWDEQAQQLTTQGDKLPGPALRELLHVVREDHDKK